MPVLCERLAPDLQAGGHRDTAQEVGEVGTITLERLVFEFRERLAIGLANIEDRDGAEEHCPRFFSRVALKREEPGKGKTVLATNSREEEDKQKELSQAEKGLKELEDSLAEKSGDEKQKIEKKMAEQKKRTP